MRQVGQDLSPLIVGIPILAFIRLSDHRTPPTCLLSYFHYQPACRVYFLYPSTSSGNPGESLSRFPSSTAQIVSKSALWKSPEYLYCYPVFFGRHLAPPFKRSGKTSDLDPLPEFIFTLNLEGLRYIVFIDIVGITISAKVQVVYDNCLKMFPASITWCI